MEYASFALYTLFTVEFCYIGDGIAQAWEFILVRLWSYIIGCVYSG